MSTRCRHAEWIAQPSRKRYLYHCRACNIVVSHDIAANIWDVSQNPEEGEDLDEPGRQSVFAALDRWMTKREVVFGHDIFVHPESEFFNADLG